MFIKGGNAKPREFREEDFQMMRDWGFNFARVMIDYRYFCRPGTFEPDAALFPPIDELIGWGRTYPPRRRPRGSRGPRDANESS